MLHLTPQTLKKGQKNLVRSSMKDTAWNQFHLKKQTLLSNKWPLQDKFSAAKSFPDTHKLWTPGRPGLRLGPIRSGFSFIKAILLTIPVRCQHQMADVVWHCLCSTQEMASRIVHNVPVHRDAHIKGAPTKRVQVFGERKVNTKKKSKQNFK